MHVYKLSDETLRELCLNHPSFGHFLAVRANQRQSHFTNELNDFRHVLELQRKRRLEDFAHDDNAENAFINTESATNI